MDKKQQQKIIRDLEKIRDLVYESGYAELGLRTGKESRYEIAAFEKIRDAIGYLEQAHEEIRLDDPRCLLR